MHFRFGAVVGRIVVVLGVLLLFGLASKLVVAMLTPVLPEDFIAVTEAGWDTLFGFVSPALGGFTGLCIVGVAWWVVAGRGRG